jgi:hypothetical protein
MNNITPYTYLIKFKPTGQVYYGLRFKNVRLNRTPEDDLMHYYTTSSDQINSLLKEHGLEAFDWEVRKTFKTQEDAMLWESKVLRRCKVLHDTKWFNQNIAGRKVPSESGLKVISETHKGIPKSAEHAKKIGDALRGKVKGPLSEETKNKISNRMSGINNPMYGKGCTDERARKIGEANKGRIPSNKGKPMSEEQKAKIRATKAANPFKPSKELIAQRTSKVRGKKRTPEQRENIRQGVLKKLSERKI